MLLEAAVSITLTTLLIALPLATAARLLGAVNSGALEYRRIMHQSEWRAGELGGARCDAVQVGSFTALHCRSGGARPPHTVFHTGETP